MLVVGVGLETRHLAGVEPGWRFIGVDPAPAMLDPFDAAACMLVIGLIPDDGAKLAMLQ